MEAIAITAHLAAGEETLLVRRARRGEMEAFEELYRLHLGRVYALCRRLSGDPARAEDLTQGVFVRVWQRLDSFRGDGSLAGWVRRVALNVALGYLRSPERRELPRETVEPATAAPAAGAAPDLRRDLEAAIGRLPSRARTVFVLHDVEGYRHAEIARLTGRAVGTCKAQLHRARRLLREMLTS